MQNSGTVVISAAGRGTRLQQNTPKSLVKLQGRTIIEWQLRQLTEVQDIVVVVGFQGRELANEVWKFRPDVTIAINHDFSTTRTAASLRIGARVAKERVIGLDGDVLVSQESLRFFLESNEDLLGIMKVGSTDPHKVKYSEGLVWEFDTDAPTEWEWTGPLSISKTRCMEIGDGHVYEGLKNQLPIKGVPIDGIEIDYPQDIQRAEDWISAQNGY